MWFTSLCSPSVGDVCADGLFQRVGAAPGRGGYAQRNGGEGSTQENISRYLCCSQSSVFTDDCHVSAFQDPHLGMASFSMFGSLGAAVQVVLILYPFYPIHI